MNRKKVSIIIPIFNIQIERIKKLYESLMNQTYKNIEIIAVNDGSSAEYCKLYNETLGDNVVLLNKINGGVSSARNRGIDVATGEYITFVDADDYIDPEYVEYLVDLLEKNDADISCCCCNYIKDNPRDCSSISHINKHQKILDQKSAIESLCYMKAVFDGHEMTAVWGKLYTRKSIANNRFDTKMSIGEDFIFNYYVFQHASSVVIGNRKYYNYLLSETGAMHSSFSLKKAGTIDSIEEYAVRLDDKYYIFLITRLVNIALILFLMISDEKFINEKHRIENYIKKYRANVLLNMHCRIKLRIAMLISYFGFGFVRKVYSFVS